MAMKIQMGIKMVIDVLPTRDYPNRKVRLKDLLGFVDDALPEQLKKITTEIRASYRPSLEVVVVIPEDTDFLQVGKMQGEVRSKVLQSIERFEEENSSF